MAEDLPKLTGKPRASIKVNKVTWKAMHPYYMLQKELCSHLGSGINLQTFEKLPTTTCLTPSPCPGKSVAIDEMTWEEGPCFRPIESTL